MAKVKQAGAGDEALPRRRGTAATRPRAGSGAPLAVAEHVEQLGLGEARAGPPTARVKRVADEAGTVALVVALVAGEHELEEVVDLGGAEQLVEQRRRG